CVAVDVLLIMLGLLLIAAPVAVLGLSVVKMLLDAWELWSAVKRRIAVLHYQKQTKKLELSEGSVFKEPPLMMTGFLDDEVCNTEKPTEMQMLYERDAFLIGELASTDGCISPVVAEGNPLHHFDLLFWDDGGRAIG
ncbi:membrane-associated protein, putative, partial [Bodo saltans]